MKKFEEYLSKNIKEKDIKYLIIILFILPIALFFNNINDTFKEIKKLKKEINVLNQNIITLNNEKNIIFNNNIKYNVDNKKINEIINKTESFDNKVQKFFNYFSKYKIKKGEWVSLLEHINDIAINNNIFIKNIIFFINKNNSIEKIKTKKEKKQKIANDKIKEIKSYFVNFINNDINKKNLLPKYFFYIKFEANNYIDFLNFLKTIENDFNDKLLKILSFKLLKYNKEKQTYEILITFYDINKGKK